MHEFTLASQLWESVSRAAQGRGRVVSVSLEVGELSLLSGEGLAFWIRTLAEREGMPGVEVQSTIVPGRIRCRACGAEGGVTLPEGELDHHLPPPVTCLACGSGDVEIIGGRDVRVVSARVEPISDILGAEESDDSASPAHDP